MARDRNPSADTSLGGCQPLRSYRSARDAQAVGAEPYLCACGYWHRRYLQLPTDDWDGRGSFIGLAPEAPRVSSTVGEQLRAKGLFA